MSCNFETSRRVNFIYIAFLSAVLVIATSQYPDYWILFTGLFISLWIISIYLYKQQKTSLSFQYGILTRRTLLKEYVYDIKEYSSIRILSDSEGTDSIYGVKLVNGKMKKKTLLYDVYRMKLKDILHHLNEFLEIETPIDELEKEQLEHEINVVLYQTVGSILIVLSTVMNFAFLFMGEFHFNYLITAILAGITLIFYTIQSRDIARNNLLSKIYTVIGSLLFGVTLINFFIIFN